jgi:hypothetical protein
MDRSNQKFFLPNLLTPSPSGTSSHAAIAPMVTTCPNPLPKNCLNTAPVNPMSAEM